MKSEVVSECVQLLYTFSAATPRLGPQNKHIHAHKHSAYTYTHKSESPGRRIT